MASKQVDIHTRKDLILGITVEQYIRTVSPVSSAFIAQKIPLDLNSINLKIDLNKAQQFENEEKKQSNREIQECHKQISEYDNDQLSQKINEAQSNNKNN